MKKEIIILLENEKELKNALNNAIIALNDIYGHFHIGIEIPKNWLQFLKMDNDNYEECIEILKKRLEILYDVYNQLAD